LVSIGQVLSEEKIFEKVYDVRRTPSDGNSELKLRPPITELHFQFFYVEYVVNTSPYSNLHSKNFVLQLVEG
jgi:hypothetical protein